VLFWDTSALVKAYVSEPGTPIVKGAIQRLNGRLFLSAHVALEVLTTLSKQVRSNQIGKRMYRDARTGFLSDLTRTFNLVEVGEATFQMAYSFADRHRDASVGAMDVLHLATALQFQSTLRGTPLVVASSDSGFLSLAGRLGLPTFNPEAEPLGSLLAKAGPLRR
jgi:predicted nucleic acid-binding protein